LTERQFLNNLAEVKAFFALFLISFFASCGYTLQNSRSPLRDNEDIYTVFVNPLNNATYKPGVENVVYNAVVRAISSGRRINIVYNRDDADAELFGSVNNADSGPYSDTSGAGLTPTELKKNDTKNVNSFYEGTLSCNFALYRIINPSKKNYRIWGGSFSRKKPFPSSARLGPQGATTSLINESEFDRAILELSDRIADEMHESMLAMF